MQGNSRDARVAPAAAEDRPLFHPLAGAAPAAPQPEPDPVTAVLVVHNGAPWLHRTLAALQALSYRPSRVIAVDTGSTDASAQLLRDSEVVGEILTLPGGTTFGAAVAAAAQEQVGTLHDQRVAEEPDVGWLWLLHDDSAPEPDALLHLLATAQRTGAAVAGPKVRGWHDQALLVECGLSITNSGRRFTGLQVGDRDQGQRDDLTDVLAVGSAGMLVRRDAWQESGGFDPALPMYGDDIEFCMRARRAGERVVVAPQAVIHHREAATHGVRSGDLVAPDPPIAARAAAMYTSLVHGPAWILPITSVVLLLRSAVSAVVLLFSEGPRRAASELRVWAGIHLHPLRIGRARRRLRQVATVPRGDLRPLRPRLGEQLAGAVERWASVLGTTLRTTGGGAPWGLGRAAGLAAVLAVIALFATREVWMARGPLAGGALLPVVDGSTLLSGFRAAWHDVGLGSAEPSAPYVFALIVGAAPPVVSVDFVVQTLLLFTVPLAGLSAFLALRGLRKTAVRMSLSTAYALTPAAVSPSLDGRLGTATVAVLLPWLLRLLVRIHLPPDPGYLPAARVRTVAAAALVLSVVTAFAPLAWLATAVLALIALVVHGKRGMLWVWTGVLLVSPLLLLWPWSWSVLGDPSRIMFEAGVSSPQLVAGAPPGWRLLLLDPGTMGSTILPVAVGLVVAAVLGLLLGRSRPIAVWGWLVVAVGLLGATVQTSQRFLPLGATTAQYGFAGPMLHFMAAGMVLAAAALAAGVGAPKRAATKGITALATLGVLAGPLVLAGMWLTQLSGPLQRSDATVVPAFVAEQAVSPAGIRTLLLDADASGAIGYALVNGAGGRLGDADVAPPAATWGTVSAAVGGLAAGVGPAPVAVLADNAVKYVVASTRDPELAAALDGNSALRRLSTTGGEGLWVVEAEATRARLVGVDGQRPVGVSGGGASPYLDTSVEPGAGAQLRIAQYNDGGWLVSVDGVQVPAADGQPVTVDLPGGPATAVVVWRDQSARDRALLIPLAALLVLLILLLPSGHIAPAADPDAGDDEQAPPAGGGQSAGAPAGGGT